jgi:hypothetical protein
MENRDVFRFTRGFLLKSEKTFLCSLLILGRPQREGDEQATIHELEFLDKEVKALGRQTRPSPCPASKLCSSDSSLYRLRSMREKGLHKSVQRFFTPYSNNLCRSSAAERHRPSTTPSPAGRSSAARRDLMLWGGRRRAHPPPDLAGASIYTAWSVSPREVTPASRANGQWRLSWML